MPTAKISFKCAQLWSLKDLFSSLVITGKYNSFMCLYYNNSKGFKLLFLETAIMKIFSPKIMGLPRGKNL